MSSTPYFTSRQRSTYTRPNIHAQSASRGNQFELRRSLVTLNARMGQVETRVGGASISLKTSTPVSSAPPSAQLNASASTGVFRLQITNPQFKVSNKGNLPNTPMWHKVQFSATQDFSSPTTLPPTQQTQIETSQFGPGARMWVGLSSSFDGINYNTQQVSGPYQS